MPIYEYVCKDCNSRFETIRPMKEADVPIPCKNCNSENTHRTLSTCFSKTTGGSSSSSCSGCSGGNCSHCH